MKVVIMMAKICYKEKVSHSEWNDETKCLTNQNWK